MKIYVFEGTGLVWPKISRKRGRPYQPFFPVRKLDEWGFRWYNDFVLAQFTRLTERET